MFVRRVANATIRVWGLRHALLTLEAQDGLVQRNSEVCEMAQSMMKHPTCLVSAKFAEAVLIERLIMKTAVWGGTGILVASLVLLTLLSRA
jgi:hypothetical protein